MELDKIIQFGTFAISICAALVAWRKGGCETKKLEADAVGSLSDTALNLVKGIEERLKDVETELEKERENIRVLAVELETERRKRRELEARVEQLENENAALVTENGHLKQELEKRKKPHGDNSL